MTETLTSANRLLAHPTSDLASHDQTYGPLPSHSAEDLLTIVQASGLTGRGGGGFPMSRKLVAVRDSVRAGHADRLPVVIGNGAEGEPASSKDRVLLRHVPHLVLDGLQIAAAIVGASRAFLYVNPAVADVSREAVRSRLMRGPLPIDVVVAPKAFVAGQESAAIAAVEGRAARPRDQISRVAESGLHGAPTLVQNVETLAHLALIARYGAVWFRSLGDDAEPGTFLVTVSGAVARRGVFEAPYGATLGSILDLAGGVAEPLQAVLVGGYHGAWIPPVADLLVSRTGLAAFGAHPGAGVVMALPASTCGLVYSARVLDYLAGQSVRQCGPCGNGLPSIARTFGRLADPLVARREAGLDREIERLGAMVAGRGACQHPDGAARFARSSLTAFGDETRLHRYGACCAGRSRS